MRQAGIIAAAGLISLDDCIMQIKKDHNNAKVLAEGLNKIKGKVFRIGHLGDFNDLMLAGTLAGVEMGLKKSGIPHKAGGVMKALDFLSQ